MTGGAGFSRDAMNRSKSNRSMKTSNRKKFKAGYDTTLSKGNPMKFKEVSDEELKKITSGIREKSNTETRKTIFITAIIIALLFLIVFFLFL